MASYKEKAFLQNGWLLFASIPLQHILFCIIDSGCTSRDVLQSYFDLLGELMKFNIDAFKRFNKYVNTEEKVQANTILSIIRLNWCDSVIIEPWFSTYHIMSHEMVLFPFCSFRHFWHRSTVLWLTPTCWCDALSFPWTGLRARQRMSKVNTGPPAFFLFNDSHTHTGALFSFHRLYNKIWMQLPW